MNDATSAAAIDSVLDGVPVFRRLRDAPLFSAEQLNRLSAARASEASLLSIALNEERPFARRVAAIEAMAQRGEFNWRGSPVHSGSVTSLLARSIPTAAIHNHWGVPGISVEPSGSILIDSRYGVTEALMPLLDDRSSLTIVGSEPATLQALAKYRVADLAAWLLLKHRGEPWIESLDPATRDESIARLRLREGQ